MTASEWCVPNPIHRLLRRTRTSWEFPRDSLRGWECLEDRTVPAQLLVTNVQDEGAGSLRAAIDQANRDPDADVIRFAPALEMQEILLESAEDSPLGPSALVVSSQISILGQGQTITRAPETMAMRLFHVTERGDLTLQNVNLSHGLALGGDGASGILAGGGAAGLGGAIYNQGRLTITASTLLHNQAIGGNGGDRDPESGLYGRGGTPSGNGAKTTAFIPDPGAGLVSLPRVPFGHGGDGNGDPTSSRGGFGAGGGGSISSPQNGGFAGGGALGLGAGGGGAGLGGAIFNQGGHIHTTNTTFTYNSAIGGQGGENSRDERAENGSALGGAIFNLSGIVTIVHSTLARNFVELPDSSSGLVHGGAVYSLAYRMPGISGATADVKLVNSILADTLRSEDLYNHSEGKTSAQVDARGTNLIQRHDSQGGSLRMGEVIQDDPMFSAFQTQQGYTKHYALAIGSPAIDASSGANRSLPAIDQRGALRDFRPDLGSYEVLHNAGEGVLPSWVVVRPGPAPLPPNSPSTPDDGSSPVGIGDPNSGSLILRSDFPSGMENHSLSSSVQTPPQPNNLPVVGGEEEEESLVLLGMQVS